MLPCPMGMDRANSIDTIGAFSAGGSMGDSANIVSMEQLLSQQLHGLIDFTTVLTRRLVLLEQKVQQLEAGPQQDVRAEREATEALLQQGDVQMSELRALLTSATELGAPQLTVIDGQGSLGAVEDCQEQSEAELDGEELTAREESHELDAAVAESHGDEAVDAEGDASENFDDDAFLDEHHDELVTAEGFEDDDSQMPLLSA